MFSTFSLIERPLLIGFRARQRAANGNFYPFDVKKSSPKKIISRPNGRLIIF
jgi:hypothetical protein